LNSLSGPLVSVVIPVYNGESTIRRAVDSILNQSYANFELLVVNDASTDQTGTILRGLKDSRIRIINVDKNIGRSAARNLGIDQAKGDYIAMLDADDWSYRHRLAKQVDYMNIHKSVVMCGSWAQLVDSTGHKVVWKQPIDSGRIRKTILMSNTFIQSTIVAKRQVLKEVGGYCESLEPAEDYDLCLRIAQKYSVANIPAVLGAYTVRAGIKYSIIEQWYKTRVKWRAIFKYGYPKRNLICLLTPIIAVCIPRRIRVLAKSLLLKNG